MSASIDPRIKQLGLITFIKRYYRISLDTSVLPRSRKSPRKVFERLHFQFLTSEINTLKERCWRQRGKSQDRQNLRINLCSSYDAFMGRTLHMCDIILIFCFHVVDQWFCDNRFPINFSSKPLRRCFQIFDGVYFNIYRNRSFHAVQNLIYTKKIRQAIFS